MSQKKNLIVRKRALDFLINQVSNLKLLKEPTSSGPIEKNHNES